MTPPKQETFEDAVDNASVRSLTKRSPSMAKRPKAEKPENIKPGNEDLVTREDDMSSIEGQRKPAATSNRLSNTSNLDNVNLDDDSAPLQQGWPAPVGIAINACQ
jgi:hypothetical protein